MMTSKEIRESFKNFFKEKGHKVVPSAPMVIKDDPTLMFTNAGMNQFKDIILGNRPAQAKRVTDSQKCLRVSGKHNDLEEVGHDTYHHTMFEMLGNWSFGDYFKHEAIDWAWEYLVDVLKLNPDRLYATVFEGYAPEGLERDNEGAGYWEAHLPKSHIINGNRHDNFWEMGETGPCGPCSEIHIDLRSDEERAKVDGAELVNKDNPLVIEIWNLVFMQYNRKADGHLEPLPAKVIDTGMGFERLCMAMQGKKSNYDTDVFTPFINKISELSGKKYGVDDKIDIAMRVAADHVRTIAFSIADSQLPSNAKAGYVIRRILRRAVRYVYTFLDQKEAFLYKLVDTLVDEMGDAYPELPAQKDLIKKVIKEELKKRGENTPFDVASNPEFLKEGAAIKDFMSPDRVVVGVESEQAREKMSRLYRPFLLNNFRVIFTDIPSAEMIKYAANSMLATRISFMNDIANLCELVGADVNMVRKGIGSDSRIGSFLYPGCGYGGSCFPKDVKALIRTAEKAGYTMKVLHAVEEVNEAQKQVLYRKLEKYYNGDLAGKTVALWGLSFKPETDDMRDRWLQYGCYRIRVVE